MTQMTVHRRLAYTHCSCDTSERHSITEAQLHHSSCLWRDIIAYQAVNPGYRFLVRPVFSVVFLIVKEIPVGNALMDIAVTDMVEAAVPDSFEQISTAYKEVSTPVEQLRKHIMDNVARKVIVVQKRRGQPVHLRIMCFEKPLYVISVSHTL